MTRVAEYYHLTITSGAKKGEILQVILNYLCDEEHISDEEGEEPLTTALRRLELEEKAKEREGELRVKEIQLKEKELEGQL